MFLFEMTHWDIIVEFIYFVGTMVAFLIGLRGVCMRNGPLYFRLIIYASGCRALEGLASFVGSVCSGQSSVWGISDLSVFAASIFIISANVGQINGFLDDGVGDIKKKKLLALIAPAVLVTGVVLIYILEGGSLIELAIQLSFVIPDMICSYYCLKQLLLPIDEMGFLKTTRAVNIFLLIDIYWESLYYSSFFCEYCMNLLSFGTLVLCFAIVLSAVKGVKIWKTLV